MLSESIPGFGALEIKHLVLDLNGTLTVSGEWLPGVLDRLAALAEQLQVHILTADTYGVAQQRAAGLPVRVTILGADEQARQKAAYLGQLGAPQCVAVGNGRNDALMLAMARIGMAVIEGEGCAGDAWRNADVVCRSTVEALDLLLHPVRLRATLRC